MPGLIPEETLQAIRDRISLVDLVSTYVNLKQNGRNHIGLCPFHNEKTPSFSVSDERGFFKCFGCGEGGNAFTFLMKVERLEFPEAVEQLAKRAGVELPERSENAPAKRTRESLIELHEDAADFFRKEWASERGEAARRYLEGRGVSDETIEAYGIGLSPAAGSRDTLTRHFGRKKVSRRLAVQSGLLGERDRRVYDRFRGRIMFPIRDRRGRVIAFGGRTLGDEQPKYLNSPETPIFTKGDGVYGVAEARKAIRDYGRVVLVEGYMDALMLVQAGIPYAVATLGTALTAQQLRLVRGVGGEQAGLFFFFDGDRAGRQAALRAINVCAEAGVWGRPAFLPDGMDPDDFVRANGVDATLALLDEAPELIDFYLDETVPVGAAMNERSRAAKDVGRVLAKVQDPVQLELMARRAAERLGVSEGLVVRAGRTASRREPVTADFAGEQPPDESESQPWPVAERMLLEAIALDEAIARWVLQGEVLEHFEHAELGAAASSLCEAWDAGESVDAAIDRFTEDLAGHLGGVLLSDDGMDGPARMRMAEDCVTRISARYDRDRRRALVAELRRAERSGDAALEQEVLRSLEEMRRREGDRL